MGQGWERGVVCQLGRRKALLRRGKHSQLPKCPGVQCCCRLFWQGGRCLVLFLAFSGTSVTPGDSICSLGEPLLLSNVSNLSFGATSPSLLSAYFSLLFLLQMQRTCAMRFRGGWGGDTQTRRPRSPEKPAVHYRCEPALGLG